MRATPPHRRTAALALLLAAFAACSDDPVIVEPLDVNSQPLAPITMSASSDGIAELLIPTYDGSGQSVEPAVLHLPGGWRGFEYWMAQNPYPKGDPAFENPSIVTGPDGFHWAVPDGVKNPVVPLPSGVISHNSDPELVYLAQQDKLVLFYRAVTGTRNIMFAETSADGVHWSTPSAVLDAPNHSLVSPAVVLAPGRRAKLYYVDSGPLGCSSQYTGVALRRWLGSLHDADALVGGAWSGAVGTDLAGPPGWIVWHLHVIWVDDRKEYWAVFPAYRVGSDCSHTDLFVARSRDAVHWQTLPDPIMRRGDALWADRAVYRASIEYDETGRQLKVWFSALAESGDWRVGIESFPITDLAQAMDGARPITTPLVPDRALPLFVEPSLRGGAAAAARRRSADGPMSPDGMP